MTFAVILNFVVADKVAEIKVSKPAGNLLYRDSKCGLFIQMVNDSGGKHTQVFSEDIVDDVPKF